MARLFYVCFLLAINTRFLISNDLKILFMVYRILFKYELTNNLPAKNIWSSSCCQATFLKQTTLLKQKIETSAYERKTATTQDIKVFPFSMSCRGSVEIPRVFAYVRAPKIRIWRWVNATIMTYYLMKCVGHLVFEFASRPVSILIPKSLIKWMQYACLPRLYANLAQRAALGPESHPIAQPNCSKYINFMTNAAQRSPNWNDDLRKPANSAESS